MADLKLISWNVNGIRASVKKGFVDIFNQIDADVFCLQETKAQDDQVAEALAELSDYHLYSNSAEKKGYSGTAIISKQKPLSVTPDIGIAEHDNEGRVLCAEYNNFFLVNVYVPNSGSGLKRLDYRAEWDVAFMNYLDGLRKQKALIVTGDFNVAHTEIDLARPKPNYDKTAGYTQKEIDGFDAMLGIGLTDTFRAQHPEKIAYTFWNVRFKARERNVGWRIDYFLASEEIMGNVKEAAVHDDIHGSDHCPIGLKLSL